MTNRGRPLPFNIREQIREYRHDLRFSERRTANLLSLHRNTVKKYSQQVCTTGKSTERNM